MDGEFDASFSPTAWCKYIVVLRKSVCLTLGRIRSRFIYALGDFGFGLLEDM